MDELAAAVPGAVVEGDGSIRANGLAYDSRRVQPGDLFVCWRGWKTDGHLYVAEAMERGAVGIACERRVDVRVPVQVLVSDARAALGWMAAALYDRPSSKLRVLGVTGTNGKTTTTFLLRQIWRAAGIGCGLIGTVQRAVGERTMPSNRTTPESSDVQRLLAEMRAAGDVAVAMEVSSHAIALKRTVGTEFDVGVFTNLTHDHLEFHADLEAYRQTKISFIASVGRGAAKPRKAVVVNADDPSAKAVAAAARVPVLRYGLESSGLDVSAEAIDVGMRRLRFRALTPSGAFDVEMGMTGRFNVYNALAAIAAAVHEGIPLEAVQEGLARAEVPGRFERVEAGQPFGVIVDYAHTPDGLENVLKAARSFTEGRLIAVFGAGGDRDKGKRALMGEVGGRLADVVIVTSDNPRSEEPAGICREVEAGVRRAGRAEFETVVDRREAIRRAVEMARPGDLVLIAGKGHEDYQEFDGRRIRFDDREEAAQAIAGVADDRFQDR